MSTIVTNESLVPWKRLWLALDTFREPEIVSSGFLESWEDLFGLTSEKGPKEFEELLEFRCLVLCGEPGMGKSKALELSKNAIEQKARQAGNLYWRSFREALSPEHLLQDLKNSSEWQKWIDGSELTVVIDGVDEGLALASNFLAVLLGDLRDRPVERLRLILACRDAEWPVNEGRLLLGLWKPEQAGRFQLQRLRASDAEQAARHWGLSDQGTSDFMSAVHKAGVEAFAARPLTLRMLVDEFRGSRQLPGKRSEIFLRACLRLCREELSRSKFLKRATGFSFAAEQILPVAERVAAVMLLCRYNAVSISPATPQQLDFEKLIPLDATESDRAKLEAALGCGLFADAGNQGRTFAHQSYAEFMAAEYLARFPLAQVLNLVCLNVGSRTPVVPQLSELAAWLALRDTDFANWLIKHEPEILLRNDASTFSEAQREQFVAGFLGRLSSEEAFDDWDLKRFYGSFRHSKLADQLRPLLKDSTATRFARRAAIHLAGICELKELFEELLAVAKDENTTPGLRQEAMAAVCRIIPAERLAELEPFASGEAGPDPDDELRGAALKALVPKKWKASTALPSIAKPFNQNFLGEFHTVCESYLPKQIELNDLAALLEEIAKVACPFEGHYNAVRPTAIRALILAASNLDKPKICSAFLGLITTKLRAGQLLLGVDEHDWRTTVTDSATNRRRLTKVIVEASGVSEQEVKALDFHKFTPIKLEDCSWFLSCLESALPAHRARWAKLAWHLWPEVAGTAFRDDFFEACARLPELASEIRWPCVTTLNSEDAKHLLEMWAWQKRNEEATRQRPPRPTAQQLFDAAFTQAKSDWRQWHRLCWELQRHEDGSDIFACSPDPTNKHRWQALNPEERKEVILCARSFLVNATAEDLKAHDSVPLDLFWALWLTKDLLESDNQLHTAVEKQWFAALFGQPFHGAEQEQALAAIGVAMDPVGAVGCLRTRLMASKSGGIAIVLSGFEFAWNDGFTKIVLDLIGGQKLKGGSLCDALLFLGRHDLPAVTAWITDQLKSASPNDLATTLALGMALCPSAIWQDAKTRIGADTLLATEGLQTLADLYSSHKSLLEVMDPSQLGDLFLVLESTFSSAPPLKIEKDQVSARERIEGLRNAISEALLKLATESACEQLTRLAAEVPHLRTSLHWRLRDTRLAFFRKSWLGVPIDVLTAMGEKRERRWVRSEDDLQELILDSIARFQANLNRTEYPTVPDLWNEKPELSPKDEIALTQKLVRWFGEDLGVKNGAAVGCQVEPSLVHETDIEVWAQPRGVGPTGTRFVVTIEVKCSFNQEAETSLEKQLVAEYLVKLGRTHGIYLVGWYKGEGFKPKHNPLGAKNWADASQALSKLLGASRTAHPDLQIDAFCLDCEFPQAFRKRGKSDQTVQ